MTKKRNPGRFTIQFNMNDPMHITAAGILDRQGRHKAQFITNAISFYQSYHDAGYSRQTLSAPDPPGNAPAETTTCGTEQDSDSKEAALQSSSLMIHGSEDDKKRLDEIFEEAELPAIATTLSAFNNL